VIIIALEAVNHNHGRRLWMAEVMLKMAEEIRNVIFRFTLRTHYAYVEVYELSTVQIRETHFRFRFHFKRLKIANPKNRKSENSVRRHPSIIHDNSRIIASFYKDIKYVANSCIAIIRGVV